MEKIKRTVKEYIRLVFNGFAMGAVDVIPGVSGGTMAFILGIYEELIDSIRQFASADTFRKIFKFRIKELYTTLPWPFLLAVFAGIITAIASLAKFIGFALKEFPEITYAFFFGLIIASILTVLKRVKRWSTGRIIAMIAGIAIAFFIVTLVPVDTEHAWWNIFFSGIIAICAMILPGISGSFLLLIMGQYEYILGAVNVIIAVPLSLLHGKGIPASSEIIDAVVTICSMIAGCIVGLSSFVHLLNWLFKKFHDITVALLIGFMIGSLWKLWPWHKITEVAVKTGKEVIYLKLPEKALTLQHIQESDPAAKIKLLVTPNILPPAYDTSFMIAVAVAVFGFAMVMILEKSASAKGKEPND